MGVEENKKSLYRLFEEVWNQGDLSVIPEVLSPDYVGHNPRKDIIGIDGFERAVKDFRAAVPDGHWTVNDIVGEGDKLAVSFTIAGTQTTTYKDREPTGKLVTNKMLIINRYVDGKCVESTPYSTLV
jgi:predicted ester cyclase